MRSNPYDFELFEPKRRPARAAAPYMHGAAAPALELPGAAPRPALQRPPHPRVNWPRVLIATAALVGLLAAAVLPGRVRAYQLMQEQRALTSRLEEAKKETTRLDKEESERLTPDQVDAYIQAHNMDKETASVIYIVLPEDDKILTEKNGSAGN
jgi:hypothetical protein